MTEPILPSLKPIAVKERLSVLFIERGQIDVIDGAFVVVDKNGVRTHVPVGGVTCLMLEPGTRVSHAAVTLASRVGCLLVWVGEAGVRLYASGQPGGARADRLLFQAKLALDDTARLKVVRKMYELRFKEKPPERRSVQQLRGIEGARVRKMYELLARQYRVPWTRRNCDHTNWGSGIPSTAV
ncbi:MAG: type I-E CRISPR-associated endonuclease Cas1e [Desulfobulbales bacterium]|nr:type I-E CRISPR-associated endonuclease Cas1e [Desulfobulbales bacterium]